MKIFLLIVFVFVLTGSSLHAQISALEQAAITVELQKRGLSEEEITERLEVKGINLETIDITNPAEIERVRKATEEILADIEKEEKQEETAPEQTQQELADGLERSVEEEKTVADKLSQEPVEETPKEIAEEKEIVEELSESEQKKLEKPSFYGQQIFRNQSIEVYRESKDFHPPDSYVLGFGDRIAVSIWGVAQVDFTYEIDESGYIKPTTMPRISLKGFTYGKAKKLLLNRFSQYYQFRPEEFEMTISATRTLSINVFGEAETYGSFTLPAFNTAFNALVAAGGPSDIGSVRDIRLIRGNQTKKIDVYKFMINPAVQFDFYLEDNDIIYIPVAEKLVTLSGAVKKPFIFELLAEENLTKLLEYAGGLKANAYQKNIQIIRKEGDKEILIDVNLRQLIERNEDFILKNDDKITIRTIPESFENFAEISGAVKLPGSYALQKGMKLSDLIEKGVLDKSARLDIAYLERTNEDRTIHYEKVSISEILENPNSPKNFTLKQEDKISILSKTLFIEQSSISITGAVRKPGVFNFDPTRVLKLEDIILLAGGLENSANQIAYVQRIDTTNQLKRNFLRVNVFEALQNPSSLDNIILEPFDKITIYTNEIFTDDATITTSGAFRKPIELPYDSTLRVSDIIYLSDGLKPNAAEFAYIERADIRNRDKKEYIRLNIKNILENPNSTENIRLQQFDKLSAYSNELYSEQFSISISGAIQSPGEFQYDPSLTILDVVTLAGGFKLEADKNRIDIFRVLLKENEPAETVIAQIGMDENFNIIGGDKTLELFPFDKIVVREVPHFELQQMITLRGEVNYPGVYAIADGSEKIRSIIERAGGLTAKSFPEGSTLKRSENDYGQVILKLDKVMKNRKSKFNYLLKPGDVITIPKSKELVSISGATDVYQLYQEEVIGNLGRINIAYHNGRRAKFYVKKYAGGLGKNGRWRKLRVIHPNGVVKKALNFGLFTVSPKVKKGSEIIVGAKPPKPKEERKKEKEPVNWEKIVSTTLAQVTAVVTLVILINKL